jgi:hypothetical protein
VTERDAPSGGPPEPNPEDGPTESSSGAATHDRGTTPVPPESLYYSFASLSQTAGELADASYRQTTGAYHFHVAAIVMSAFSIEAYLNHVGRALFEDDWDEWARLKHKMTLVTERLGLQPDYGRRPFQSFMQQVTFRNAAAHARTEVIRGRSQHEWRRAAVSGEEIPSPRSRLQGLMPRDVNRSVEDVREIIRELHLRAHQARPDTFWQPGDPLLLVSETSF